MEKSETQSPGSAEARGSVTGWAVKWKDASGMEHAHEWDAVWKAEAHTGTLLSQGADEVIVSTVKLPNAPSSATTGDSDAGRKGNRE